MAHVYENRPSSQNRGKAPLNELIEPIDAIPKNAGPKHKSMVTQAQPLKNILNKKHLNNFDLAIMANHEVRSGTSNDSRQGAERRDSDKLKKENTEPNGNYTDFNIYNVASGTGAHSKD
jgi:hypothetical protein